MLFASGARFNMEDDFRELVHQLGKHAVGIGAALAEHQVLHLIQNLKL